MVTPTGKDEPMAWSVVSVPMAQLSVAVGAVQLTVLEHVPAVTFCVMLEGIPEITGLMASPTLTVTGILEGSEHPPTVSCTFT